MYYNRYNMNISKERKISIIGHSIAIAVGIALMVVASFYDLKLSQAIGNQHNFYGQLFAIIAEYPSYWMVPIAGAIIFYNSDLFDKKGAMIGIKVLGAVLVWFGWFLFSIKATKLVEIEHLTLWSIFKGFFYGGMTLIIFRFVPKDTIHRLFKFAVFSLVFIVVALAVMQIMKNIWCRMRYRDMLKEGNCDGFTPWWQIMLGREKLDPSYHYTSFPSGHSSSITHLFLLCVLCDILPSWKSKKWLKPAMYAGVIAVVSVGAFSRIVNCAHFLSDVVAGVYITYGIFYLLKWLFFRGEKYQFGICCRREIVE